MTAHVAPLGALVLALALTLEPFGLAGAASPDQGVVLAPGVTPEPGVAAAAGSLATEAAAGAGAARLAIGLATDVVEVHAGFSGADVVLFGAITGPGESVLRPEAVGADADIVAVTRGPPLSFRVRRMQKRGLFWTPGAGVDIDAAPGLYLTSSTRALDDIAPHPLRDALGLGADSLRLEFDDLAPGSMEAAAGFLDDAFRSGRYANAPRSVTRLGDGLFKISLRLPPNTPVGDYAVEVFLIRNGVLISADAAALSVRKIGLERQIYELAHRQPLGYGIVCVTISLLAGWLAAAAFRK